ncbi:MAG: AAA family ATPase [Coriobacteriia bacterium]|nr:AAA family ATPase [Coriobacteriia bacterium]
MGIIEKVHIEKFRMFRDVGFELGDKVTIIAGQNGTMKSTLLGMLGQPFSMRDKEGAGNPYWSETTIDGLKFESKFSEKFKFSPRFDIAGDHEWTLDIRDDVYPKGSYTATSIPRKGAAGDAIRIWSKEGKGAGTGYIQAPVIYLSLKRLLPIGEEKRVQSSEIELSSDEKEFFERWHNEILILSPRLEQAELVKSSNKSTMGYTTEYYDALTNSAGQDNIGKIILSILSFKRLKEKYPSEYQGGLLLIDELDATLYPAAEVRLVEALFRFASDYDIQVIFTTHSERIIETVYNPKYSRDARLVFLEARDRRLGIRDDLSLESVKARLRVESTKKPVVEKIRVYSEDNEAVQFIKALIPRGYLSKLNFVNVPIGGDQLVDLRRRGIPEFLNSLVVLDGDKRPARLPRGILLLPGDKLSPEILLFRFLRSLPEGDDFWQDDNNYSKQVCFRSYPGENIEPTDRLQSKSWYREQLPHWGRSGHRLYNRWKDDNKGLVSEFQDSFEKEFKRLSDKNND